MDKKEKLELSESDICAKFITPAILKAGWDEMTQIRREFPLTPGPVIVRGNMSSSNKKKSKRADYLLQMKKGLPVAIVEAKANQFPPGHGMQQALGYADILSVPSAFSSNGDAFASHNKAAAEHQDTETEFLLEDFPGPDELWQRYCRYDPTAAAAADAVDIVLPEASNKEKQQRDTHILTAGYPSSTLDSASIRRKHYAHAAKGPDRCSRHPLLSLCFSLCPPGLSLRPRYHHGH